MLTQQENELFTRVSPGTRMGELLRRYWHPVGCSELVTSKPQRVKVLGEELVLYRGEDGRPVLMQLRCAHRGVALDHGRVEGNAIRCPYHGWLFGHDGQCLAVPSEPESDTRKDNIRLVSYETQEVSGLVFAYMGPAPTPVLPLYDLLRAEQGEKAIMTSKTDVNWFQAVENILDVSHFSWLHGYTFPIFRGKRIVAKIEPAEYGLDIDMCDETGALLDQTLFAAPGINRFALPSPRPGDPSLQALVYRVPLDDTSVQVYFLAFCPSADPGSGQKRVVHANKLDSKFGEYQPHQADWWGIDLNDQDRMAMEQQGVIADRTKEHLVASDVGIVRMRRMLRGAVEAIERGEDPIGIIRDPAKQNIKFKMKIDNVVSDRQEDVEYATRLFSPEGA